MMERELARKATVIAYRNAVIGDMKIGGSVVGKSPISYAGDFPFQAVADSVALPRSFTERESKAGLQRVGIDARTKVHKSQWDKLFKAFDQAWLTHERKAS